MKLFNLRNELPYCIRTACDFCSVSLGTDRYDFVERLIPGYEQLRTQERMILNQLRKQVSL